MSFLGPIGAIAGIAGSLLGGGDKPSSSQQSNQAFGQLNSTYGPQTHTGVSSNNFMAGLLGVPGGDTAGSDAGFKSYLAKAGYAPALERLQAGITQGAAAKGLLNSGSTQKALVRYGSGLDQQFFNNYFQNLNTLDQRGIDAGQVISGAGGTSSSSGAAPGIISQIGSGLKGGAQIGDTLGKINWGSIFN